VREDGRLPIGWKKIQLGKVAQLSGRIGWKGLTAKEYTKEGPFFLSVHSLNYGDYVDYRDAFHISQQRYDESPEIMLRRNDVLICKDGAGIGKLGIVGDDLPEQTTINSSLLLIRAQEVILPKYLYYSLLSPYFQCIVKSRLMGATTPHLYQRDITEFPIYLPPLPEQRHIVTILDEAFAGLATATANAEKNLNNARELFESHLNSFFAQKEAGWTGKTLSDLVEVTHGFAFDGKCFVEGDGDHPILLTPGNFTEVGSIDFNEGNTKRFTGVVSPNFVLRKHDLVVVMTDLSSKMKILGKPAFVDRDGILHNQRIGRVIFKDGSLWPEYLYYFFRTAQFIARVKDTATGTMVKHTAPKRILAAVIPIPPTLDEQKGIAAKLNDLSSQVEQLEVLYQEKLLDLTVLKQALLQKAFSGELSSPPSQAIKEAAE
jgi:type I restriction enzyme S subunit